MGDDSDRWRDLSTSVRWVNEVCVCLCSYGGVGSGRVLLLCGVVVGVG